MFAMHPSKLETMFRVSNLGIALGFHASTAPFKAHQRLCLGLPSLFRSQGKRRSLAVPLLTVMFVVNYQKLSQKRKKVEE